MTYERWGYLDKCMQQLTKKGIVSCGIQSKILPENQPSETRRRRPLLGSPSLRFALDSGFLVCASVYPLGEEVAVFGVGVLGSSLHMSGEGLLVRGCVHLPGKQARADGLCLAAGVSSLLQSHFKHFYQNQLFVMFPQNWTLHSVPHSSSKRWSHCSQTSEACCPKK